MPDDVLGLPAHDLPHLALQLDRRAALVELLGDRRLALVDDLDARSWKKIAIYV